MLVPITCDGCGACCRNVTLPPFLDTDSDDRQRLRDAPIEALAAIEHRRELLAVDDRWDNEPCCWLDVETQRCRFYSSRPTVCREFELGGDDCIRSFTSLEIH
jgi:Fe-S-cluster containining protein